jgi:hypothetical protein
MSDDFKLIGTPRGGLGGNLELRYGSDPNEPIPFILTLTPQYVARELGKTPPVAFAEITKYAEENANKLIAKAKFEKGRGRTTLTLD